MYRILVLAISACMCCANVSAQLVQAKLDHVVIAVHDLEAAKRLYSGLGFSIASTGRHPTGTESTAIDFLKPQQSLGYLELITPYDATLSLGRPIAEFLKQGEGAKSTGLRIASADQAARDLRAAGLKISGPTAGTIVLDGDKAPPPPRWWIIEFMDQVASRPLFLIQYQARAVSALPPRPPGSVTPHPNSSTSLSGLLIAVNDLDSAAAWYGSIAKPGDREISMPEFGATAKEMVLEQGSIFLLKATDPAGPTARRLKARGEGILGVKIDVTDLNQARKQIGERNVSKRPQSILVSPENAAGVWLEFQAQQ